jgi:hypothetical protein
MTALDELKRAEVGDEFLSLLHRTVRAVAIARNFPAPVSHDHWDADAIKTVVGDFLASAQTPRRLQDLATHCRTEDALKRRLQETVRNFLADAGRQTPVGRLVLRINEVLGRDEGFERQGRCWAIAGSVAEPAAVDIDALARAVSGVAITVPTAWTKGSRQSPEIDADSVVRLARAVLDAAGGPISAAVIAQAVAKRLGLGAAPLSIEATAFDPPQPSSLSPDTTGNEALLAIRVHEVFGLLNDVERVAIGVPAVPVAELGPMLGVSGSKAALIRKRAVAILKGELGEEEGGQAVADAVFDLAQSWTQSWMTKTDPT